MTMSERVDEIRERCDRLAVDIYDKVGRCHICNMGHDYGHEIDCPANLHHDVRDLLDRLEGEPVAWLVDCGMEDCEVEPSVEKVWPPAPPKPPGKDGEWGYGEYECGVCGVRWDEMIVTPLYRRTHQTPEEG